MAARRPDADRLQDLYERADAVRREHVGDAVHLRGLIEISSHCVRQCMYCGLRRGNHALPRYRMTRDGDPRVRAPGRNPRLWHRRHAGRRRSTPSPPNGSPRSCGGSSAKPRWPSRSAWASARNTSYESWRAAGPTATCCALKRPIQNCFAASTRVRPRRHPTAHRC